MMVVVVVQQRYTTSLIRMMDVDDDVNDDIDDGLDHRIERVHCTIVAVIVTWGRDEITHVVVVNCCNFFTRYIAGCHRVPLGFFFGLCVQFSSRTV